MKNSINGVNHPYHKSSKLKKRIHGWLCYQIHSYFALLKPDYADIVMYELLKDQYEGIDIQELKRKLKEV